MKPFEEYYYIGKPNDETILPYYFYEFVCLVGDKEDWFSNDYKTIEWDTVLVKGRWRDGPRRNYNEEIDSMEDYYVVHKDDTQQTIKEHYPDIDPDAAKYIIQAIIRLKKEEFKLDNAIDFMWQKLGLEEKCVVERKPK